MSELVFVYDRTKADVDRAKELFGIGWSNLTTKQKTEWLNGLKGCLNTSDLARIENNIYEIAKLLKVSLETNKDSIPAVPKKSYFGKMLDNVKLLRDTGYIYLTTPVIPKEPINTYQKVNDIERILRDIYSVYEANNSALLYCGTGYSGEEYGLI